MSTMYDDNYGHWECESEADVADTLAFYKHCQKTNVEKKCMGCGRVVRIQPHYAYCNSCCERMESGQEY